MKKEGVKKVTENDLLLRKVQKKVEKEELKTGKKRAKKREFKRKEDPVRFCYEVKLKEYELEQKRILEEQEKTEEIMNMENNMKLTKIQEMDELLRLK